ncbi:hypothetical protein [Bartonella sp. MR63HLJHH]|uniref:hypothetical protein n=1 Tax=Bartonella sp. MR63HLJHH TaxID=3243558 RepID=UPI0035D112A7
MLFPEEDNCSAGAHSQAEGAGGIIGEVIGGIAGAVGGLFSGPKGVGSGFVNGAIGGGLAGAGDAVVDKYNAAIRHQVVKQAIMLKQLPYTEA